MEEGVVEGGNKGREGDWACSCCNNRNYAFRSLCNRCKSPRVISDTVTPAHSKWLPRIGDWICTGCTNNNYASREICKKCGEPKEGASVPATEMPGSSFFVRAQGLLADQRPKYPLPLVNNWSMGAAGKHGIQQTLYFNNEITSNLTNSQFSMDSKGWRNGDWVCNCGFHNYASRAECKNCNATMPPALGTKRLASEEIHDLVHKRPYVGPAFGLQRAYPPLHQPTPGAYLPASYPTGHSFMVPNVHTNVQCPPVTATPTLLGKGAMQWRDGDWMCTNCSNHNYANRTKCNRCKTQKDAVAKPVSVS